MVSIRLPLIGWVSKNIATRMLKKEEADMERGEKDCLLLKDAPEGEFANFCRFLLISYHML